MFSVPKSGLISILQYDERTLTRTRIQPSASGVEVVAFDQERGHWPGGLEQAVAKFVARLDLAGDRVVTVLPRHLVTVRILTLPTHDSAEAANMIRFSAEEYVPYPQDELIIQDAILRKEPGGESKVLAVLAHRDVLKNHLAPLRKAGIIPERVLLSTACLANAVAAANVSATGPYGLVNLGAGGLEVLVFLGSKLLFGRGVASEQDWSRAGAEAASADDEIAVEVRGSLSAFRRESEDGEGVEQLFVSSDYPVSLDERAVSLGNETGKDALAASFAAQLADAAGGPVAPLIALGAALSVQGRGSVDINLLPATESRARAVAGAKVLIRRAGVYAAALLVVLLALYGQAWWQRQAYIRELEAQLELVEPGARGLAEKQEQLSILRQQMRRSASPVQMLAVAADALPDDTANIVQFRYNLMEGADVFGRAKSVDVVQRFAANLRDAAAASQLTFFKNAHSLYEDRADERGMPIVMYQISIPAQVEGTTTPDDAPQAEAPAAEEAPL